MHQQSRKDVILLILNSHDSWISKH